MGPARGPWIRRRQIARTRGPIDVREPAQVVTHRGEVLAWGLVSPAADILVRVLSWGPEPPPPTWLEDRLAAALAARVPHAYPEHGTTGYREVNSEGDRLPGLVVDRYGAHRVVQLGTAPMAAHEDRIVAWLREHPPPDGVDPEIHVTVPGAETPRPDPGPDAPAPMVFTEYGLPLRVPAPPGQKTGGYLDQRRNRRIVAELARRHGGPLLDLGCHVGGFALHAARLGVPAVGLDRSAQALAFAADAAAAAGVAARCEWVQGDMFAPLDDPALARTFGTVVLDPPRLVNRPRERDRAMSALVRLVRQATARLAPTGHLVLCSCSHHLDRAHLDGVMLRAGGGPWARVFALGAGPDHPVAPAHVEGEYLRVNVYQRRTTT